MDYAVLEEERPELRPDRRAEDRLMTTLVLLVDDCSALIGSREALEARLPRGSRLIMAALREAGTLSTGEVAEAIGVSRPTASTHLRALRDAGLVVWSGKSSHDPRASWSLPDA
jgi:DNA-binding MarR family transcriptional regulator